MKAYARQKCLLTCLTTHCSAASSQAHRRWFTGSHAAERKGGTSEPR